MRKVLMFMHLALIYFNPFYRKSYQLFEEDLNEKYLRYAERRYRKFIEKLPKYKGTHKKEDVIWWCWLQGEEKAPELCKACLASLRKNVKGREIRVVTLENYQEYAVLPEFIIEKHKKGLISNTHFSDILRLQLLTTHGGTWIDASVLMTRFDERIFEKDLFMFRSFLRNGESAVSSSWFITAEKGNPILLTVRDLLFEYWRTHNVLERYFLFHIFVAMAAKKYPELWRAMPNFPNAASHVLQFELDDEYNEGRFNDICEMSSVHKLSQKRDFDKKANSMYNFIVKKYLGGK